VCPYIEFPPEVLSKAAKRIRFGHGLETLVMWDVPVRIAFDALTALKPNGIFVGWSESQFRRAQLITRDAARLLK
jgi:hypothetical protein